ncbi:copper chaperone PCu(A)C [Pseudoxanthomonas sp. z9]|uniref:copper chaperone PCu(A)C n=1 Tax=Pseudoxanthomonas sp. z9 TaxID=2584942 RepID=UPI00114476B4|nr:copper chaperone PCu(A)C [Pseudoxanthomonas sp. z9]MCL6714160.1 copper chaperone PCu(A)C [Pseudomonas sp. R2.Fl]
MNRRLVSTILPVALLLAGSVTAHAAECLPTARQAWIRLPPSPAMPMMAGFLRIDNACAKAVEVTGADSLAFAEVSLHESRQVDGVNKMRELETLPVAAGKSVEFKPGGLHLMLYKPYAPVKEGDKPVITLKLKDGRSLPVTFEVRKAAP